MYLQYLSALLCHKKFASDFMNYEGLQLLMDLPYNQRASTGISTCFYALVFHSTVMERLCSYSRHLIAPMMTYDKIYILLSVTVNNLWQLCGDTKLSIFVILVILAK